MQDSSTVLTSPQYNGSGFRLKTVQKNIIFLCLLLLFPAISKAKELSQNNPDLSLFKTPDVQTESGGEKLFKSSYKIISKDMRNFYLDFDAWDSTTPKLLYSAGIVALFANSKMDGQMRNYYQEHIRSDYTDKLSHRFKPFGKRALVIPLFAGLTVVDYFAFPKNKSYTHRTYIRNTLRSYVLGGSILLACQLTLGGSRPEVHDGSKWGFGMHKGDCYVISGHSFIGAVPFMAAARMTDSYQYKIPLYLLSVMPALSRINDDSHYFSQTFLGIAAAYLSTEAVFKTEEKNYNLSFNFISSSSVDGIAYGIFLTMKW